MGILKDQLNKQIDSKSRQYCFGSTTGTIIEYENVSNTATIKFGNPQGEGTLIRYNVPIAEQAGGIATSGIRAGMKCTIEFYGGNIMSPVITGVNTSFYNERSAADQGAFLVTQDVTKRPEDIIPMCEQWIDEDNDNPTKYLNDLGTFDETDMSQEAFNMLSELDKYGQDEQGITNLDTKATVKTRANGDIDIFIANNIGLRLSKKDNTIYLWGDLVINGEPYRPCTCSNVIGSGTVNKQEQQKEEITRFMKFIDGNIDELKRSIENTKGITGDADYFNELESNIAHYEEVKYMYNSGAYESVEETNKIYTELLSLYNYFQAELAAGRYKWGME